MGFHCLAVANYANLTHSFGPSIQRNNFPHFPVAWAFVSISDQGVEGVCELLACRMLPHCHALNKGMIPTAVLLFSFRSRLHYVASAEAVGHFRLMKVGDALEDLSGGTDPAN